MRARKVVVISFLVGAGIGGWWTTRTPGRGRTAPGSVVAGATSGTIAVHGSELRVSGPFVHKNLTVFLLHADDRDETDFLTLDEGLASGSVSVSEKAEQAQVNELEIENRSDRPLFVQVGDRLKGGKQDRIVGSSFVVPPRSGKQPIRSFCVEAQRWSAGPNGVVDFCATATAAAAPNNVRAAALSASQGHVWEEVAREKGSANAVLRAPNTSSTLNETLDSAEARKGQEAYERALGALLDHAPDVVGFAFARDGKVEEVDVFPGWMLARKQYPKLLASHALRAAATATASAVPVMGLGIADVRSFLVTGEARSSRHDVFLGNDAAIVDYDGKAESETNYRGRRFIMATGK